MGYVRIGEDLPDACSRCRFSLRREFNFCPSCGDSLRQICSQCRAVLEAGWNFCASCGAARGAAALLAEAGDESPAAQRAEALNARGTELYENDRYEDAIREFSSAAALAPSNSVYRTNLAVALSEMGEYEQAVSEFRDALSLNPENVSAHLQLGYTYQEMEKPRQAVDSWRKVLELAPDSPEAEEAREALDSI